MGRERGGEAGRRGGEGGFTLLEVLIAFVIAALALGVLFRAAAESRAGTAVAAAYQEALARGRSRLAVLDAGPLRAQDGQGDDGGGFRWRVRVAPLRAGVVQGEAGGQAGGQARGEAPMLFAVEVDVSWTVDGRERSVRLETRRLGAAPPAPP